MQQESGWRSSIYISTVLFSVGLEIFEGIISEYYYDYPVFLNDMDDTSVCRLFPWKIYLEPSLLFLFLRKLETLLVNEGCSFRQTKYYDGDWFTIGGKMSIEGESVDFHLMLTTAHPTMFIHTCNYRDHPGRPKTIIQLLLDIVGFFTAIPLPTLYESRMACLFTLKLENTHDLIQKWNSRFEETQSCRLSSMILI
jgi:hypothetical protein